MGLAALTTACTLEDVTLEGKSCPCAPGWHCDEAREVCLPGDGPGGRDAGTDGRASDPDAGGMDAASGDASSMDAPGGDAAPPDGAKDAGPEDGAAGDAPVDAPPPDAGPDESVCDDALSGAVFCDGFEDGAGFAAWDMVGTTDGTVDWVTDRVYRGGGAMRAEITAAGGKARVLSYSVPSLRSGDLWMRAYFYLPSGYAYSGFNLVAFHEETDPWHGMTYAVGSTARPYIWFDEPYYGESAPALAIPRDRWTCLQLHIVLSDTAGSVRAYVDGALAVSFDAVDTTPAGGYDNMFAGITYAKPTQGNVVVYVDEIAVGTSPLPCD